MKIEEAIKKPCPKDRLTGKFLVFPWDDGDFKATVEYVEYFFDPKYQEFHSRPHPSESLVLPICFGPEIMCMTAEGDKDDFVAFGSNADAFIKKLLKPFKIEGKKTIIRPTGQHTFQIIFEPGVETPEKAIAIYPLLLKFIKDHSAVPVKFSGWPEDFLK